MNTSSNNSNADAEAVDVRFTKNMLVLVLNDEREIALPLKKIKWLKWLSDATPRQRANWQIEPHGYAVWWNDLDDGIEVAHALNPNRLPHRADVKQIVEACTA